MGTAFGSTAESIRSETNNPLQLSTRAPSFTTRPELHRLTSHFADHTNDRGDFTYDHENNQNYEGTPSLSLLDNCLDGDATILSDLGYTAGAQSMGPGWNFE
jgi:hypothetical protein